MIKISQLNDVELIRDDPEMWREVYGYLSVCAAELTEYEDEDILEEYDFNFLIASDTDSDYIQELGTPEELVDINIHNGPDKRTIRRLVYTTEVIFMDIFENT